MRENLALTIVIVANSFLSAGSCVRHAGVFLLPRCYFEQRKQSRDYLKPITSSISSQIIILYYFSISLSSIEPLMDKNDNLRPGHVRSPLPSGLSPNKTALDLRLGIRVVDEQTKQSRNQR